LAPTLEEVRDKFKALASGLSRLPLHISHEIPPAKVADDFNKLRRQARRVAPQLNERCLGPYIGVFDTPDGRFSLEGYAEMEEYANQIAEQLGLLIDRLAAGPTAGPQSAGELPEVLDAQAIRQKFPNLNARWCEQDEECLQFRFVQGASMEGMVSESGRTPGALLARLRKLGYENYPHFAVLEQQSGGTAADVVRRGATTYAAVAA
jgi:hypothetical protein